LGAKSPTLDDKATIWIIERAVDAIDLLLVILFVRLMDGCVLPIGAQVHDDQSMSDHPATCHAVSQKPSDRRRGLGPGPRGSAKLLYI
jgi:hypothetical protein